MKPEIAISMGDPAGIGPEVLVKALADPDVTNLARWRIAGDSSVLRETEKLTGLPLPGPEVATILDQGLAPPEGFPTGKLSAACGRAALSYVRAAVQLCLDGRAVAVVTGPLNKEAVTMAGENFSGHTEFIAEMCGASDSRMLLVNDRLRIVHVSTHVPLRQACNLEPARILRTIELGKEAMELLGIVDPRIAVCGLNPHAGESGLFGEEDRRFIAPAIEAARRKGIRSEGPVAADTVFLKSARGEYDLVVAMYHDQGHIAAKLLDFERTVNVSLGLPIIRTSVDHGTAFDIAGKNLADASSMKAAMKMAAAMSSRAVLRRNP
jgi:4-phospho-D-threonate 3-dehydrogenase / 4-phospho-D-erythronate 3-dehydrogenase